MGRLRQRKDSDFWVHYKTPPVIDEFPPGVPVIYLKPGQYLTDIIDADGNIKK